MQSKYIDLVVNRMKQAKYDELKKAGAISNEELYIITDHDDLFYYKTETYNKEEIDELLKNIDVSAEYYTKTESDNKFASKTDLENIDLSEYYTKVQTDNTFATKAEIPENIYSETEPSNAQVGDLWLKPTTGEFYDLPEYDSTTAGKNLSVDNKGKLVWSAGVNEDSVNEILETKNYATKDDVDTAISTLIKDAPTAYDTFKEIAEYIESDLSNAASMLASINNKPDKDTVYTKAEANAQFATKSELENVDVDLTNYYTKTETEGVIDQKIKDIGAPDLSKYDTSEQVNTKITNAVALKQDISTAYNKDNVVYSETQPSSPTEGMLWIKPVDEEAGSEEEPVGSGIPEVSGTEAEPFDLSTMERYPYFIASGYLKFGSRIYNCGDNKFPAHYSSTNIVFDHCNIASIDGSTYTLANDMQTSIGILSITGSPYFKGVDLKTASVTTGNAPNIIVPDSMGEEGQVLTSHGEGAAPTWETVSSGGGGGGGSYWKKIIKFAPSSWTGQFSENSYAIKDYLSDIQVGDLVTIYFTFGEIGPGGDFMNDGNYIGLYSPDTLDVKVETIATDTMTPNGSVEFTNIPTVAVNTDYGASAVLTLEDKGNYWLGNAKFYIGVTASGNYIYYGSGAGKPYGYGYSIQRDDNYYEWFETQSNPIITKIIIERGLNIEFDNKS